MLVALLVLVYWLAGDRLREGLGLPGSGAAPGKGADLESTQEAGRVELMGVIGVEAPGRVDWELDAVHGAQAVAVGHRSRLHADPKHAADRREHRWSDRGRSIRRGVIEPRRDQPWERHGCLEDMNKGPSMNGQV